MTDSVWGKTFLRALRRGDDYGYAAYLADLAVERANLAEKRQRDQHNLVICAEAAARYRGGGYDLVKIECFNEAEADKIAEVMARLYPDVPCVCTFRFSAVAPVSPNGESGL